MTTRPNGDSCIERCEREVQRLEMELSACDDEVEHTAIRRALRHARYALLRARQEDARRNPGASDTGWFVRLLGHWEGRW